MEWNSQRLDFDDCQWKEGDEQGAEIATAVIVGAKGPGADGLLRHIQHVTSAIELEVPRTYERISPSYVGKQSRPGRQYRDIASSLCGGSTHARHGLVGQTGMGKVGPVRDEQQNSRSCIQAEV